MSASWARELTDIGATRAKVAFRAESATTRGFFITFRTNRARQTVSDTLSVQVIVEGSWRTSNDRLSVLTVATLWTWDKLKVCSSFLTVVASRAVSASLSL